MARERDQLRRRHPRALHGRGTPAGHRYGSFERIGGEHGAGPHGQQLQLWGEARHTAATVSDGRRGWHQGDGVDGRPGGVHPMTQRRLTSVPEIARGERGIALIMALMVLLAMSLLAVLLMVSLQVETKISGHSARYAAALNIAEAGVG